MRADEDGGRRRLGASAAFTAGVEFGRMRRKPTEPEREVWRAIGQLPVFLRGVRHGRRLNPRGAQMTLGLRAWR